MRANLNTKVHVPIPIPSPVHEMQFHIRNSTDFKFCVAVFAYDISVLKRKLAIARKYKPDLVELRLDYLRNLDETTIREVENLARKDILMTLRSKAEGGNSYLDESKRVELIERFVTFPNCLVDVEIDTLKDTPGLVDMLESSSAKVIASYHNFSRTPSQKELMRLIKSAPSGKWLHAIKIACRANSFEDNRRILSLYASTALRRVRPVNLIAFCMGEQGVFSRFASLYYGSPFTYASLPGEATAPGQLDVVTMRAALGMSAEV